VVQVLGVAALGAAVAVPAGATTAAFENSPVGFGAGTTGGAGGSR
jgi:pectate lyase